jgi:hypothetical protein
MSMLDIDLAALRQWMRPNIQDQARLYGRITIGVVVLIAMLSAKINAKFDAVYVRLDSIDKRFDGMRDLGRAELRRVEEVWTHA